MSAAVFKQLDITTLTQIANHQKPKSDYIEGGSRKRALTAVMYDIESDGVRQLIGNLKLESLYDAVSTLEINHGDNNPRSKPVLTKRLKESFHDLGVKNWLNMCNKLSVLQDFARALNIRGFSTMGIRLLRKSIEEEIDILGTISILGSLSPAILKDCCYAAKIQNYEVASSKTALVNALIYGTEIALPQKTRKRGGRKPKFAAIEDCETYDQLFQHYKVEQLVAWCKDNSVKSSGTKKVLINRILAFLQGDKENTMVDPERANKKTSSKPKAAPKEYPAPTRKSNRKAEQQPEESESESEEDPMSEEQNDDMETSEQSASELSEDVVAPEATIEESESQAMELSSSEEDPEHPTTLEGLGIFLRGRFSKTPEEVGELISRHGGSVKAKLTKKVDVIICNNPESASMKKVQSSIPNIKIVTEDYLRNLH